MTTQLDCSIGIKKESVYGTAVTVDQFLEFTDESLATEYEFGQGGGLRPGSRVDRLSHRRLNKISAGGGIGFEIPTKGFGIFLEALFGAATTNTVESGVYQHVFTLGSGAHPSYTIQKGLPTLDGAGVETYTMPGSQCESLELDFSNSDFVKAATEWMSREVVTDVAYATPSYPDSEELLSFVDGAITMDTGALTLPTTTALGTHASDATTVVRSGKLKIANGIDGEGFNLGGAGKKTRAGVIGKAVVDGSLTMEFEDETQVDAFLNQDTLKLLLTFTHPSTIGAASAPVLQISIPALKLEGGIPSSNGGDVITVDAGFTVLDDGTNEPITVVYRSTDATV